MSEEGVSEFVKKEETEVFIGFEIENRFFRAEEEFAARLESKLRVGGFNGVEKGEVFLRKGRGCFWRAWGSFLVANVVGEN